MEGLGSLINENSEYLGYFKDDFYEGFGSLKKGETFNHEIIGTWKRGVISGFAKEILNSKVFFGQFENGIKKGVGRLENLITGTNYYGEFKNNIQLGFGCLESPSLLYYGEFKDQSFSGEGYLLKKEVNSIYYGEFRNGTMEGRGIHLTPQITIEGNFQGGNPQGVNIVYFQEEIKLALFKSGKLVSYVEDLKNNDTEVSFEKLVSKITAFADSSARKIRTIRILLKNQSRTFEKLLSSIQDFQISGIIKLVNRIQSNVSKVKSLKKEVDRFEMMIVSEKKKKSHTLGIQSNEIEQSFLDSSNITQDINSVSQIFDSQNSGGIDKTESLINSLINKYLGKEEHLASEVNKLILEEECGFQRLRIEKEHVDDEIGQINLQLLMEIEKDKILKAKLAQQDTRLNQQLRTIMERKELLLKQMRSVELLDKKILEHRQPLRQATYSLKDTLQNLYDLVKVYPGVNLTYHKLVELVHLQDLEVEELAQMDEELINHLEEIQVEDFEGKSIKEIQDEIDQKLQLTEQEIEVADLKRKQKQSQYDNQQLEMENCKKEIEKRRQLIEKVKNKSTEIQKELDEKESEYQDLQDKLKAFIETKSKSISKNKVLKNNCAQMHIKVKKQQQNLDRINGNRQKADEVIKRTAMVKTIPNLIGGIEDYFKNQKMFEQEKTLFEPNSENMMMMMDQQEEIDDLKSTENNDAKVDEVQVQKEAQEIENCIKRYNSEVEKMKSRLDKANEGNLELEKEMKVILENTHQMNLGQEESDADVELKLRNARQQKEDIIETKKIKIQKQGELSTQILELEKVLKIKKLNMQNKAGLMKIRAENKMIVEKLANFNNKLDNLKENVIHSKKRENEELAKNEEKLESIMKQKQDILRKTESLKLKLSTQQRLDKEELKMLVKNLEEAINQKRILYEKRYYLESKIKRFKKHSFSNDHISKVYQEEQVAEVLKSSRCLGFQKLAVSGDITKIDLSADMKYLFVACDQLVRFRWRHKFEKDGNLEISGIKEMKCCFDGSLILHYGDYNNLVIYDHKFKIKKEMEGMRVPKRKLPYTQKL